MMTTHRITRIIANKVAIFIRYYAVQFQRVYMQRLLDSERYFASSPSALGISHLVKRTTVKIGSPRFYGIVLGLYLKKTLRCPSVCKDLFSRTRGITSRWTLHQMLRRFICKIIKLLTQPNQKRKISLICSYVR